MNIEEAEVEMYKRHKRYFEEVKAIGTGAWCSQNCLKGQIDVQRDIGLFKVRYSSKLEIPFYCDGCSYYFIGGCVYRCHYCTDMNLCKNCFNSGKIPSDHLDWHEFMEFRFVKVICNFQIEWFNLFRLKTNHFGKFKEVWVIVLVPLLLMSSFFCLLKYYTFFFYHLWNKQEQMNTWSQIKSESFFITMYLGYFCTRCLLICVISTQSCKLSILLPRHTKYVQQNVL